MLQAGSIGLLGLGMNHVAGLREASAAEGMQRPAGKAKSCVYIFLSGGLARHDSFDMKPEAPENIRGEFQPIATRTPGIQICEHLPLLAERSHLWALVRSLTHPSNEHSMGHQIMLSGRTPLPPGFSPQAPKPTDWPSIAAVAGALSGGAGVDFLQQRGRGTDGGGGRFGAGEAAAEQELLVFLVELENLENAGAGALQQVACIRIADTARRHGAQGLERGIELFHERALALDHLGGRRKLVLAEKTIFLERALVQLVTKLLVLLQGFR